MHFNSRDRLRRAAKFAVTAAALGAASSAMAACPPGWTSNYCYSVQVQGGASYPGEYLPNYQRSYGDTAQSVATPLSPVSGGASAVANGVNNGTLIVKAAVYSAGYTSIAYADLQYSFQLVANTAGPLDPFVRLNVNAIAQSLRDSNDGVDEFATFSVLQDGVSLIYKTAYRPFGRETTMFTVDQWINVRPEDDITIIMGASSIANPTASNSRIASGVYVDPTFTLDPAYAGRYSFVGLPEGVTSPPSAVPEPASWAMLVGGFGLIGGTLRRRQRTTVRFA